MTVTAIKHYERFAGLSTDTKPITNVPLGSTFFEWDTSLLFIFDGAAWVAKKGDIQGTTAIDQTTDGTTNKVQARNATHDNFNANANLQVGDADVSAANPVPIEVKGSIIRDSGQLPQSLSVRARHTLRGMLFQLMPERSCSLM